MSGGGEQRRGDFGSLITDEEPPQVVVVRWRVSTAMEADEDDDYSQGNELRSKSDRKLREALQRMKANSSLNSKLKDGGEKLRRLIQRHAVELRRREQLLKDVGHELKKPPESIMKETNASVQDNSHGVQLQAGNLQQNYPKEDEIRTESSMRQQYGGFEVKG